MSETSLSISQLPRDDLCIENEHGIAKTNVSVSDVQAAIVRKFGIFAQIGKMDYELISEDQGFNSKILVLRNIWKSEKLANRNGWPNTICAKIATLIKRISKDAADKEKHAEYLRNFHNVEIDVYELLSGNKNTLEIYVAHKFEEQGNKGFILMEFVENAKFCELWEHVSDSQLEQIMIDLAELHSLTPRFEPNDRRLQSNEKGFVEEVLKSRLYDPESDAIFTRALDFIDDEETSEKLKELTAALRIKAQMLFRKSDELGLPLVFGHADLWNGNVMFKDGKFKAIIDYQTCHLIQLGFEFGRLFSHLASESQGSRVLHFFQKYKNELDVTWPENPITSENFQISWELMLPFHYWLSLRCRAGRFWTTKRAKDPNAAENELRSIMKTMTKEATDGLNAAVEKYLK